MSALLVNKEYRTFRSWYLTSQPLLRNDERTHKRLHRLGSPAPTRAGPRCSECPHLCWGPKQIEALRQRVLSRPSVARVRAVPRVVFEDEVITQIAELPTALTSNRSSIDSGKRRIAVRSSRNRESGWGRMGRAPPRGRLSDSQRHGSEARNCRRVNTSASRR
jgi:hypothetical protein